MTALLEMLAKALDKLLESGAIGIYAALVTIFCLIFLFLLIRALREKSAANERYVYSSKTMSNKMVQMVAHLTMSLDADKGSKMQKDFVKLVDEINEEVNGKDKKDS